MTEYAKDLEIDKNALDDVWQNQAILFCKWAEQEVEAQYVRDKAKEKLDLVEAQLDSEIRKNPIKFKLDKVTESAIHNTVIQAEQYIAAYDNYLSAVKEAKIMGVARESFDHRKSALMKLTDLFLSQYWSEPREGKITKNVKEEQTRDKHYEALNEGMKSRRRI